MTRDPVEAWVWAELGAAQGDAKAQAARDRYAATLSADQAAEAQAQLKAWQAAAKP